ncbi:MAG: hypothetical protein J4G16_09220 [Acidobacteria bacterium]|nr:hypothetical protein [Acidobacteriota bacterium]
MHSAVGAVMDYVPEIAGLLGVVFVVWRMLTYYEKRNADAHAELGKRIDAVAADMGRRIDAVAGDVKYMRGVLDTLLASLKQ